LYINAAFFYDYYAVALLVNFLSFCLVFLKLHRCHFSFQLWSFCSVIFREYPDGSRKSQYSFLFLFLSSRSIFSFFYGWCKDV